jgi:hypothetical protein
MYASSTAGLFYFMNRNILRDNWTRGAATTKLSAYGGPVCLPRATTIPYDPRYRSIASLPRQRKTGAILRDNIG